MRRHRTRIADKSTFTWKALSLTLAVLLLSAAWGGTRTFASASKTAPAAAKLKFVLVTPNPIGADAFLQLGKVGIQKAGKKYKAATQVLEATDPTSRDEDVRAAINSGATIVVVMGFEFNDIIPKYAAPNPKVQFLIIDQCITNPAKNVRCARFKEYEVNYLLGVAAGKLTKTGKIGAIGALDIPFLHRYTDAFAEGAQHVNSKVKADTRWVATDPSGFSDPAKAKEEALAMAAGGDDQILAAAAGSNLGVFQAAQQKNFDAYGVDVNQCPLAPGHIVDNAVKAVDVVMLKSIDGILHNKGAQDVQYGLASGGLTLSTLSAKKPSATKCLLAKHPAILNLIKKVRQQIISGKIKIKDPMGG
jgi:basic membrane protein A